MPFPFSTGRAHERPAPPPPPGRRARSGQGLGYLALLPFLAGAVLSWAFVDDGYRPFVARALASYAAVVASFIGGIHWGLAFRQASPAPRLFVWGVTPSLVACAAIVATAPRLALIVSAVLLVVCYLVDRRVYATEGVARWLPLRLRLTIVATLCCVAGAAAR